MRPSLIAAMVALLALPAMAQTAAPAPAPGSVPTVQALPDPNSVGAKPKKPHLTLDQRFDAANTTHDGRLTLDQARKAQLRSVSKNFAKIDIDKKGYVTRDEVRAYLAAHSATHPSPKPAAKPAAN